MTGCGGVLLAPLTLRVSVALGCLAFITACGSAPTSPSDLPTSTLSSAPTRVVADGQGLTLTAFLSRDFMPISPPDGKPLGGVLRIKTDDRSPVPASVSVDTSWVIHDTDVWSTTVEQRPRVETAPDYEVIARNGPKWGPNVTVDVVVRLRDSNGHMFLLRAPGQTIIGTW
jgi:hypothetical protein